MIHFKSKWGPQPKVEWTRALCRNGAAEENDWYNLADDESKVTCPACLEMLALAKKESIDPELAATKVITARP